MPSGKPAPRAVGNSGTGASIKDNPDSIAPYFDGLYSIALI